MNTYFRYSNRNEESTTESVLIELCEYSEWKINENIGRSAYAVNMASPHSIIRSPVFLLPGQLNMDTVINSVITIITMECNINYM